MPAHAIPGAVAVPEATACAVTVGQADRAVEQHAAASGHWRDQALCTQADPDLWFPEPGASPRTAKLICSWCPVRVECLAWALDTNEPYGICGGLTPLERHALSVRLAAEAEPTGHVA
jgi:WhiB family transcriptional regulator, redox-sensing transcriptional regulator